MKTYTNIMMALMAAGFAMNTIAATITEFSAGEAAVASQVNSNFNNLNTDLVQAQADITAANTAISTNATAISANQATLSGIDTRITTVESIDFDQINSDVASVSAQINPGNVTIDCDDDADALKDYLDNAFFAGELVVSVSGTCNGPIDIYKDDVHLSGDVDFEIDGGGDGSGDDDVQALNVKGRNNIQVTNASISNGSVNIYFGSSAELGDIVYDSAYFNEVKSAKLRLDGDLSGSLWTIEESGIVRIESTATGKPSAIDLHQNATLRIRPDLDVGDLNAQDSSSIRAKNSLTADNIYLNDSSLHVKKGLLTVDNQFESLGSTIWAEKGLTSNDTFYGVYGGRVRVDGTLTGVNMGFDSTSLLVEPGDNADASVEVTGLFELYSTKIEIDGDFTASAVECSSNAFIEVYGNMTLTGTHEDADDKSIEISSGCGGYVNSASLLGSYTEYVSFDGEHSRFWVDGQLIQDIVDQETP